MGPGPPPTAFHSRPPLASLTRARKERSSGQNRKMCLLNAEQNSRMEESDSRRMKEEPGGGAKSCHLHLQVPRLQREPEQPYCGICQAYVEKCICKEPRPL